MILHRRVLLCGLASIAFTVPAMAISWAGLIEPGGLGWDSVHFALSMFAGVLCGYASGLQRALKERRP